MQHPMQLPVVEQENSMEYYDNNMDMGMNTLNNVVPHEQQFNH